MVPSSPNGPCSSGKTTSTSPRVRGGCPASCTTRVRSVALVGTMTLAASVSTSGTWPGARRRRSGSSGRQHPVAVLGDADRHDVVAVAVERLEHARGRRARHRVLGGAASEDEGHADARGGVTVVGQDRAGVVAAHRPRLYPLAHRRSVRWCGTGRDGIRRRPRHTLTGVTETPPSPDADRLAPATRVVALGREEVVAGGQVGAPLVLTSTYHADGDVVYARSGNPTWTAFETRPRRPRGRRRARAVLRDGGGDRGAVPAPPRWHRRRARRRLQRHARHARRPRGRGVGHGASCRRRRHRRGAGRARRRRPALARVAHQPAARGRRPADPARRRPRARRADRGRQHLRHPPARSDRSSSAPTSSCTR